MEERYAEETQTLRELLAIMHEHDLYTIKVKLGDAIYELSRRQPEAHSRARPRARLRLRKNRPPRRRPAPTPRRCLLR